MSFLYPQVLLLLLVLFYIYKKSNKATPLLISILFMVIALSRPVIKDISTSDINSKEFIIALDISQSMRATDLSPTRLDLAKKMIREILGKNQKDSFALFAFTTNALILSPFSTDHQILLNALNSLDLKDVLTKSTDITNLLKKVSKLKSRSKNLLIFSDGADERDFKEAKQIAQEYDIKIYAIALATKKGTTIKDEYGKLIKDENNHLVITRLNPALKDLAILSGGDFFEYDKLDSSLGFVDTNRLSSKDRSTYVDLFYIPLLFALILFLLHFIKLPKKVLLLLPFLSTFSDAGILDWYYIDKAKTSYEDKRYKEAINYYQDISHKTMQSELNLANSYYQNHSYKKSYNIYKNLKTSDKRIKKLLLYKMANCEAHLKYYDKAKKHYREALAFGDDKDIKYNLYHIINKHTSRRDFPASKTKEQNDKSTPEGKNSTKNQKKGSNGSRNNQGSKSSTTTSNTKKQKRDSGKSTSSSTFSHPLGYKAYDTINKGYIDEKKPW
jgi:Ca-activated chloride channel family protein